MSVVAVAAAMATETRCKGNRMKKKQLDTHRKSTPKKWEWDENKKITTTTYDVRRPTLRARMSKCWLVGGCVLDCAARRTKAGDDEDENRKRYEYRLPSTYTHIDRHVESEPCERSSTSFMNEFRVVQRAQSLNHETHTHTCAGWSQETVWTRTICTFFRRILMMIAQLMNHLMCRCSGASKRTNQLYTTKPYDEWSRCIWCIRIRTKPRSYYNPQ